MKTVTSLTYVVETSLTAIRRYSERLNALDIGDREVPALLKALTTETDVLSSALSRLSQHVTTIPTEKPEPKPSSGDALEQAQIFLTGVQNGVCPACGGVRRRKVACTLPPDEGVSLSH
jgi:hypothetical protein